MSPSFGYQDCCHAALDGTFGGVWKGVSTVMLGFSLVHRESELIIRWCVEGGVHCHAGVQFGAQGIRAHRSVDGVSPSFDLSVFNAVYSSRQPVT